MAAKKIFTMKVGLGQLSDDQMKQLLRALTAKAGLSFQEIVGAYAKRRSRISNSLLAISNDRTRWIFMCGTNPFFTARVVDENGKTIVPGALR